MAKREIDITSLTSKTGRKALPVDTNNPYRLVLNPGQLYLGYRKRRKDSAGKWVRLIYTGKKSCPYESKNLGTADDFEEANGTEVLTFIQARAKALEGYAAHEKAKKAGVPIGPVTFEQVMAHYTRINPQAVQTINAHVLPELGKLRADDLSKPRLKKFLDDLMSKPKRLRTAKGKPQRYGDAPLSPSAVKRIWNTLRAALNEGVNSGKLHDDTAWRGLKLPFSKVDEARTDFLSPEEVGRLIEAADPEFRPVIEALSYTGCRYGEICNLKVSDFQRGRIVVRKSKSGRPRDVRLQPEAVEFFRELCAGRPSGETMLLRADAKPFAKSHQARRMREACARAGIVPAVGVHALRHSWASAATMAGMPLLLVAENLGHADTRMVEKHYGHLTQSYKDDMFSKFAPTFGSSNVIPLKKGVK